MCMLKVQCPGNQEMLPGRVLGKPGGWGCVLFSNTRKICCKFPLGEGRMLPEARILVEVFKSNGDQTACRAV